MACPIGTPRARSGQGIAGRKQKGSRKEATGSRKEASRAGPGEFRPGTDRTQPAPMTRQPRQAGASRASRQQHQQAGRNRNPPRWNRPVNGQSPGLGVPARGVGGREYLLPSGHSQARRSRATAHHSGGRVSRQGQRARHGATAQDRRTRAAGIGPHVSRTGASRKAHTGRGSRVVSSGRGGRDRPAGRQGGGVLRGSAGIPGGYGPRPRLPPAPQSPGRRSGN